MMRGVEVWVTGSEEERVINIGALRAVLDPMTSVAPSVFEREGVPGATYLVYEVDDPEVSKEIMITAMENGAWGASII